MTRLMLALALAALLSPALTATADAAGTTSSGKNCPNRTSGDIKKGYGC